MALRSPLRGWPVWQLPRWLAACVIAVITAYAAAAAGALASTPVRPGDLRLCAVFVGCGAASVELTRRAGEREGLTRDVYAIWDLSGRGAAAAAVRAADPPPARGAHRVAHPPHPAAPQGLQHRGSRPVLRGGLGGLQVRRARPVRRRGIRAAMPRPGSRSLPGAGW